MMKRIFLFGVAAVLVACAENPTQPVTQAPDRPKLTVLTPPGVNLLACFSGTTDPPAVPDYGGTCTLSADHKKAVLNNTSSDPDGDYSGVYSFDLTVYGQYLTDITELSYHYKGSIIPQLGNLSYNIPIDSDGNGDFNFWAFVDAANCGVKADATVKIVTAESCGIVAGSPGGTFYPNWAAFVAAYPGAKVENDVNYIFIVAERTGSEGPATWEVKDVKFGKTALICFDGPKDATIYGGLCTLGSDFMSATLDNSSSDPDGDYSGFYSREITGYGVFLSSLKDLSFKYQGSIVPQLGNLSYNIPIDTDGNTTTEFFAFVDVANCRGNNDGVVKASSVNITKDAACGIVAGSPGGTFYPNWAAFAAAYPNARVANGVDYIFMVAERTPAEPSAVWTVKDIKWGKKK
jgi:hypothetical protein